MPDQLNGRAGRPNRQIVVCFDGTNNNLTGGTADTNVVKLCKLLDASPGRQLVYYDPGVGNPGNIPGVTTADRWKAKVERLWGLALGKGIYENIAEAYIFLMRHWEPGDDIYVFGFSRGAFTARSLAGMVARFGIMRSTMEGMVPTLLHLYFANPDKGTDKETEYKKIVAQVGADFCSPQGAQAGIWFVGVWDTVESVGSPFSRRRIHAAGTIIGKRFSHVRQALALDEHRRSFQPRPYYIHPDHDYASTQQSIRQEWFSGAHCDVGGGYAEADAELSDRAFLWMLQHAWQMGLDLKASVCPGGQLSAPAAAQALRSAGAQAPQRRPLAHSEVFNNAYWALTGLGVRDFHRARGNLRDPPPKAPVQHPLPPDQVLSPPLPPDTMAGRTLRLVFAVMAGFFFWLLHGAAVSGQALLAGLHPGSDVVDLAANMGSLWDANKALVVWQLTWWKSGWDAVAHLAPGQIAHPVWMVLADLAFILCYGYVLAVFLSRGFARAVGLRGLQDAPPKFWNALGWSGAVILLADLAEDALMLAVLGAHWLQWTLIQDGLALLMSAASCVKWLGFLPAIVLVLRGFGPSRASDGAHTLLDAKAGA